IDTDGIRLAVQVSETENLDRWDARGRLVLCKPLVENSRNCCVLAHKNEDGWTRVIARLLFVLEHLLPQSAEHGDGVVRVLEDGLGLRAPARPSALGSRELRKNPLPDVEVPRNLCARRIPDGELGDLRE